MSVRTRRRLLVATPPLDDPNFDRSVVFVLEHDATGAVGVVVNRPTPVDEVVPLDAWLERASPPAVVFSGGPVDPGAIIALAVLDGEIVTADLFDDPITADRFDQLRLFSGYAGWSPGQLDAEVAAQAWLVVDADVADVFGDDPDGLWRRVLHRQGGRTAWLATAPPDLSMN
jgi:putative transcriptional regulator